MPDVIQNGVLYGNRGSGNYVAFACSQEITLVEEQDTYETTIISSGLDKTFTGGGLTRRISFRGLFFLQDGDGRWVFLELFTNAIRTAGLPIRILYRDMEGFEQTISCNVIIPSKSINVVNGQIAKTNMEMLVSGGLTLSAITNNIIRVTSDGTPRVTSWGEYRTI